MYVKQIAEGKLFDHQCNKAIVKDITNVENLKRNATPEKQLRLYIYIIDRIRKRNIGRDTDLEQGFTCGSVEQPYQLSRHHG